jgi:predicted ATPase
MIEINLALLEHSELIRPARGEMEAAYLFKHGLVQETAYDSLLKHDRKRLHRFVAHALENNYPNTLDELAPLLAQHWDDAEEPQRAFDYYLRAGDTAAHKYANAEAMQAFNCARTLVPQIEISSAQAQDLFAQRGRVLELDGKYDGAVENYKELEAWATAHGDASLELDALNRRTTIYSTPSRLFDLERGEELAQQALALARRAGDRAGEAKVLWNLLLLNHFVGRFEQAIQYGEASLAIARELKLR